MTTTAFPAPASAAVSRTPRDAMGRAHHLHAIGLSLLLLSSLGTLLACLLATAPGHTSLLAGVLALQCGALALGARSLYLGAHRAVADLTQESGNTRRSATLPDLSMAPTRPAPAPAAGQGDRPDPAQPVLEPGPRMLVVDDVEVSVRLLEALLKKEGFQVETARGGAEAVEKARHTAYDAILMDIDMPGMNGHEATRQIRQTESLNRETPIVAVTGYDRWEEEASEALVQGFTDFVIKPVPPMELRRVLARLRSRSPVAAW